jgi:pilus assembly protein CpaB
MRSNNAIILVVALVLGGVAAFLARNWLVSHSQSNAEVGTMVVAAASLAFGAQLSAANTTEIPWTAGTLPEGAFATKQELLKDGRRMTLASFAKSEPILASKITAPNQPATLSSMIDPGKRAVTVRVDDVRGVAGFIQPGDHVDVVLIRTEAESRSNEGYSDVILQSAKVLAIDQITGERTDKPTIAKAVTLEVSAEDAQKILLASNIGRLSLILRQPAEANANPLRRVSESDLTDAAPRKAPQPVALQAPAPAPPPPPSRNKRVTIWHGLGKSQNYELPAD